MNRVHISLAESYRRLGLSEGASLEVVKSTYKQLALKTHPDKNPDNVDATAQFQRISEAYNALLKYLDTSTRVPRQHQHAHDTYGDSEDEYYDDEDEDEFDDDFDLDDDDEYDEHYETMEFYMYLFEEMMRGRGGRYSQAHFQRRNVYVVRANTKGDEVHETEEEYQRRVRRALEEQEIAEERRKREDAYRRAEQERQREKERRESEQRQKEKAKKKKAEAEKSRQMAEEKARIQLERSQVLRSAVFAAAREGDLAAVKKGIWEDEVDAAGGETKVGCESLTSPPQKDPRETLAHIAATRGDADLLEWLDTHTYLHKGADLEERNSDGLTAFHVALVKGHVPIVKYILQAHPPEDSEALYECLPSKSVIELALNSGEPEAVWLVLENKLASQDIMETAWKGITSEEGQQAFLAASLLPNAKDRLAEITNLLASFGKFTPTPGNSVGGRSSDSSPNPEDQTPLQSQGRRRVQKYPRGRTQKPADGRTASGQLPQGSSPPLPVVDEKPVFSVRGSGRARGGSRGRGRGSYRGPPGHIKRQG
ncbi:hypothetical protein BDW22DRAFT_1421855 [Trametopsis cervina]|nr:hypothetical protein BDW22DRAFT_1421855 [Trametopsis cervina]